MRTVKLFGINLLAVKEADFEDIIRKSLSGNKTTKICKVNASFLVRGERDQTFRKVIQSFDYNIVDGRGVVWAAHYLNLPISSSYVVSMFQASWQLFYTLLAIIFSPQKIETPLPGHIPGVQALRTMIRIACEENAEVFFFGGQERVLATAAQKLQDEFSGLKVSGYLNGYDYQNGGTDPVTVINKAKAKMLVVSLGSPRQEKWILENTSKLSGIRVVVGEGGTLDRIADSFGQAPKVVNSIGLEWLWRLFFNRNLTENRTAFSRFWDSVPALILVAFKYKIKNRHGYES